MDETTIPSNTLPKVIRLVRPSVVVLCGAAACGKSTFAARHFRPTQVISSDRARALVSDDEADQRFQSQAFALVHFLIEQRLSLNRLCVVDSTALTSTARRSLLDIARRHQAPATILVLDVSLATCLANDQKRERVVGQAVIERQHQLFEQAKAALKDEGFDQIIMLNEEELAKVEIEIIYRPVPRATTSAGRPESFPPRRSPGPNRDQSGNRQSSRERRPDARLRVHVVQPPATQSPEPAVPAAPQPQEQPQSVPASPASDAAPPAEK